MKLEYCILDVFTETPYLGNPLALVKLLPEQSEQITQEQKLKIAREFNLSETIFVHLPDETDSADRPESCTPGLSKGDYKVDIFLTTQEIPFAGHPTIGSATWLVQNGFSPKRLITKSGPISIASEQGLTRAQIAHNFHEHRSDRWLSSDLSAALKASALSPNAGARLCSIVKGMTFMLIEVETVERLASVHETHAKIYDLLPSADKLDDGWQTGFAAFYYFTRVAEKNGSISLRTRMMEGAQFEDPATGSAASALSCYLALSEKRSLSFDITQGVEMGRESDVHVQVDLKDDCEIERVTLSGTAVSVMHGQLVI